MVANWLISLIAGYLDGYKDAAGYLLDVTYIKGGNNRVSGSMSGKEREAVKERFKVSFVLISLTIELQHRIRRVDSRESGSFCARSSCSRTGNRRDQESRHATLLTILRQVSP